MISQFTKLTGAVFAVGKDALKNLKSLTFGKKDIDKNFKKLEQKEETKEAINFFKDHIKKIEIVRNGRL